MTIIAAAVIITVITLNSTPLKPCVANDGAIRPSVILDAGHGGIDGGALSDSGTEEAEINLSIAIKTRDLMRFIGANVIMTRTADVSLDFSGDKSIRDNKNADLKARLKLANSKPDFNFLSIHLNKFEESKYYGAQVFYSGNNPASRDIAEFIQQAFVSYIDPTNSRKSKEAHDSIYLMKHIKSPAVIVECGFLSNPSEEELLKSDKYQTQVALAIVKGYFDYIKES